MTAARWGRLRDDDPEVQSVLRTPRGRLQESVHRRRVTERQDHLAGGLHRNDASQNTHTHKNIDSICNFLSVEGTGMKKKNAPGSGQRGFQSRQNTIDTKARPGVLMLGLENDLSLGCLASPNPDPQPTPECTACLARGFPSGGEETPTKSISHAPLSGESDSSGSNKNPTRDDTAIKPIHVEGGNESPSA